MLRGLVLGSLLSLQGCGAGTYQIPNVEPVVKQKPQDDLLENIEGNDKSSTSSPSSGDSTESGSGGSADDSASSDSSKSKK